MKTRHKIIFLVLVVPFFAGATTIYPVKEDVGLFSKIIHKISDCTWHIYCYTNKNKSLGSTITTINASDRLSDSRAVINTNFSNLNTDKFETTGTTLSNLVSVGTITTGTWNATAIAVNKGGTGTTSPTANQILLGNGSSGIGLVNGFGTSGQFLTSNGSGVAPTWQTSAINTAATYSWTGLHTFGAGFLATASSTHTATTSIQASSVSGNALILNGLAYSMPGTRAASSTVLMENGAGSLSWNIPNPASFVSAPQSSTSPATANTDTTFTTNFRPKLITIYYRLLGCNATACGTASNQSNSRGIAFYDGTTMIANNQWINNLATGATLAETNWNPLQDATTPTAGTTGAGTAKVDISVLTVTNTSFTVRSQFTSQWSGAKIEYIATATQ